MTDDVRIVQIRPRWLAVDKPNGLLSVPGRGIDKQDCALTRVRRHWPDALVVHRLDMATSGLLLFARDAATQSALGRAFAERAVTKHYVAVVVGPVDPPEGTIALALSADWPNRPLQKVDALGKPALTLYTVCAHDPVRGTTRLLLQPLTGRSHQLRVHLQAIGHPIVGDRLYAPETVAAQSDRLLLHAERLGFIDPASGSTVTLQAHCPF